MLEQMQRHLTPLAVVVVTSFLAACASRPWEYEERLDQPKRPKWVDTPSEADTKTHKAFAGVSGRYTDEASARADARMRAYEEAVEEIQKTIRLEENRKRAEEGLQSEIIDPATVSERQTHLLGETRLVSSVKEYFIEPYRLHQGQASRRFFVAHALVMVPRTLIDEATARVLARIGREDNTNALERARRLLDVERE